MLAEPVDFVPSGTPNAEAGKQDTHWAEARSGNLPVIDLVHLSRQTFGDPDLERDVLALFANQAKQCANALNCAVQEDALGRLAHLIKGSARGVGAVDLAMYAALVEDAPGDRDAVDGLRASLERAQLRAQDLLQP